MGITVVWVPGMRMGALVRLPYVYTRACGSVGFLTHKDRAENFLLGMDHWEDAGTHSNTAYAPSVTKTLQLRTLSQ